MPKIKTKGKEVIYPQQIDDLIKKYIAQEIGISLDDPILEQSWWDYVWTTIDTATENIEDWMTRKK